jgi:quinol monooxygenase YgiN
MRPRITADGTLSPFTMKSEMMTLTKPIFAPTEMSKPPMMIAKLWPSETTSKIPATRAGMKRQPLHVKVVFRVKPEHREAFEREVMSVREKCIAEKECLVFDVERRSDDPTVYLLVESWSDLEYFEKVQLQRDYYPAYFAKIAHMMAAPRETHYWTRVAAYKRS